MNNILELAQIGQLPMDRIVLKTNFIHKEARMVRTNTFKAVMRDGELQIYIDNGSTKDGKRNYAGIRLNKAQMQQLLNMLQCNVK